jgi:hypothetical protein
MNCYYCKEKIPAEDSVIVVGLDEARSFCGYKCAGGWALSHSYELRHIAYFDGGKTKTPKLSRLLTKRQK